MSSGLVFRLPGTAEQAPAWASPRVAVSTVRTAGRIPLYIANQKPVAILATPGFAPRTMWVHY